MSIVNIFRIILQFRPAFSTFHMSYIPYEFVPDFLATAHIIQLQFLACYERKSNTSPFVDCIQSYIILLGHITTLTGAEKKVMRLFKNREVCSVWQKRLAFAHIATTWPNITSVL